MSRNPGDIAMQQIRFPVFPVVLPLVALLLGTAQPAPAAAIAHQARPDPLLDGTPEGPCAGLMQGPDYAAGTDAQGRPVVPPDVGAPAVALPDQIAVPLHAGEGRARHGRRNAAGGVPYVAIDGRRLDPLVNPPGCRNGGG